MVPFAPTTLAPSIIFFQWCLFLIIQDLIPPLCLNLFVNCFVSIILFIGFSSSNHRLKQKNNPQFITKLQVNTYLFYYLLIRLFSHLFSFVIIIALAINVDKLSLKDCSSLFTIAKCVKLSNQCCMLPLLTNTTFIIHRNRQFGFFTIF